MEQSSQLWNSNPASIKEISSQKQKTKITLALSPRAIAFFSASEKTIGAHDVLTMQKMLQNKSLFTGFRFSHVISKFQTN